MVVVEEDGNSDIWKWKERWGALDVVTVSLLKTTGFFVRCVKGIVQFRECVCIDHQLEG